MYIVPLTFTWGLLGSFFLCASFVFPSNGFLLVAVTGVMNSTSRLSWEVGTRER